MKNPLHYSCCLVAALSATLAAGCGLQSSSDSDFDEFVENPNGKADGDSLVGADLAFNGTVRRFPRGNVKSPTATGQVLFIEFADFPALGGLITENVGFSIWNNTNSPVLAGTYNCAPFVKGNYFNRTTNDFVEASECEITIDKVPATSELVHVTISASFEADSGPLTIAADVMIPFLPYEQPN